MGGWLSSCSDITSISGLAYCYFGYFQLRRLKEQRRAVKAAYYRRILSGEVEDVVSTLYIKLSGLIYVVSFYDSYPYSSIRYLLKKVF